MIRLVNIDENNKQDCLNLKTSTASEDFVDTVAFSFEEKEQEFGDDGILFAINNDDVLIGFVSLYVGDGQRLIVNLLIDDCHQRKGYGKEAVKLCVDFLINNYSATCISAPVHIQNISAQKFWKSLGFKPSDSTENDYNFMRLYLS